MRSKDRTFPTIANPEALTSARIWHCRYTSLGPISQFHNLRTLAIASYPDSTLEPLSSLAMLESLEIVHLPNIKSLLPLLRLVNLRRLSLSTLPSWDASGKLTVVESLQPIAHMPHLEELSLFGVVPESRTVDALLDSQSLRHVSSRRSEPRSVSDACCNHSYEATLRIRTYKLFARSRSTSAMKRGSLRTKCCRTRYRGPMPGGRWGEVCGGVD